MGALHSGLATGEVQALLDPHVGSDDPVPTHLSMGGERGLAPGSPILWTVVAITPGVGAGEGACPIYANFSYQDSSG